MSELKKSAVICYLGNAHFDSRIVNLIDSLTQSKIKVKTISFDWKTKNFKPQTSDTAIYKLNRSNSSFQFYFKFYFLLIRDLLKHKADFYFAEDVYTLPIVYFFAKLYKAKVFYNSREIYAHLAGLRNKNYVQSIIARIEKKFIVKVDFVIVTGEMDKEYLHDTFGLNNILVLRNLPKYTTEIPKIDLRKRLKINAGQKILLYQGVILEGRGIKIIMDVIDQIDNVHLVFIGDGDYFQQFKNAAEKSKSSSRIHFIGAVNNNELLGYTASADLGMALIENISLSYYYALPNKLFEYIMAGVPILCSNLPQMKMMVEKHKVGQVVDLDDKDNLVRTINNMMKSENLLEKYRDNSKLAAKELNWEIEFKS